jgi:ribosome modulation factor
VAGGAAGGVGAGDEQGIVTASDQQCPWMTNRVRVPRLSGWRESTRVLTMSFCIGIAAAHQAVFTWMQGAWHRGLRHRQGARRRS